MNPIARRFVFTLALSCIVLPAFAQAPASRRVTQGEAAPPKEEEGVVPIPPETASVTKHDWTAGGGSLHYTATAGNLLIKDEKNATDGSIFYVAYTEDGADPPDSARHLFVQRRTGLGEHLAAHGFAWAGARRHNEPGGDRSRGRSRLFPTSIR